MNKFSLLLMGCTMSTMILAQDAAPPAQQAARIYRDLNAAMLAKDTARIRELTTPDFTLTHITGYRQSRGEWLEHITTEKMRYQKMDEVSVRTEGNRVIGQSRVTANIWGMQGTWNLQLDYELAQEKGVWKASRAVATVF